MRSGLASRPAVTASAPVVTASTANPAKRRLAESNSRMFGSSSTTSNLASACVAPGDEAPPDCATPPRTPMCISFRPPLRSGWTFPGKFLASLSQEASHLVKGGVEDDKGGSHGVGAGFAGTHQPAYLVQQLGGLL